MQLLKDTPTRFSPTGRTKATRLDLAISNVDELVSDITVLPPVSDHCPVLFTVTTQLLTDDNAPSDMLVPDFTHINFDALREHLWNQPLLESIKGSTCIESAWFTWYNYFCQSVQLFVPTRKLVSKKRRLDKPWYTSDLFKLCRKKERTAHDWMPQSCAPRDVGVMLDSRLSYSAHIEGVTSRFRQRVVLLSYMAKYLSPDILDKLYMGYVRPVVEYSSPLWHSRLTAHQSLTLEKNEEKKLKPNL